MMDDRAATEVLGFILAFAVITAAIGIIYSSGFAGLQDVRDDEQLKNVERAFDVLASNVEEVRRYGTPSRSTEIRLRDGRLVLAEQSEMWVNVSGSSFSVRIPMRPVTYESNDEATTISYEGGAVFRTSEGNSVMLREPGWIVEDDRLVVPGVVTFRKRGPNSLSTAGTALLISRSEGRNLHRFQNGSEVTVKIKINTTRDGAWARYLERKGFTQVNAPGDGQIIYKKKFEKVRVVAALVSFELSP